METKIRLLSTLLAIGAGLLCLTLAIDEILPTQQVVEKVSRKYEDRVKEGTSLYIDYFVESGANRIMEVPVEIYVAITAGDELELHITPVFKQVKAFENTSANDGAKTKKGNPDVPRDVPLGASLVALLLAVFSAFVIRRFDLKIALAFLALVTTAVRWWFIGI
jgi:hypothetical protein